MDHYVIKQTRVPVFYREDGPTHWTTCEDEAAVFTWRSHAERMAQIGLGLRADDYQVLLIEVTPDYAQYLQDCPRLDPRD